MIGPDGEQVGIVSVPEALQYADRLNLDLVEVAPMAAAREARHIAVVVAPPYYLPEGQPELCEYLDHLVAERLNIWSRAPDLSAWHRIVERFLAEGNKVKLTIMFRGRELVHPHLGERLLRRMAEDLVDVGEVESEPSLDGRNMVMMLGPKRN